MNPSLTNNKIQPEISSPTAFFLGLFVAVFLVVICMFAYAVKLDGAVEWQIVPGQTLLFFDITNNKL